MPCHPYWTSSCRRHVPARTDPSEAAVMSSRLLVASMLICVVCAPPAFAADGTWSHHESCPYGRLFAVSAYDASRHRLLVAGGYHEPSSNLPPDFPSVFLDLWELDLAG